MLRSLPIVVFRIVTDIGCRRLAVLLTSFVLVKLIQQVATQHFALTEPLYESSGGAGHGDRWSGTGIDESASIIAGDNAATGHRQHLTLSRRVCD